MQTEIEAKWLSINPIQMRQALEQAGATLASPERLMIRRNFDYSDMRLDKVGGWVRVRNEGDKISLSYKQLNDRTVHGTKEVTVVVNDFDTLNSRTKRNLL
jgi:adenylate cyclase class 2